MKVQFSRNELRAAKRLAYVVASEFDEEVASKILEQGLYDEMENAPFITVLENGGVLIDVPEELVVEYYGLNESYVQQVVNIGKTIYGLLKQLKMVTKTFEKQASKLFERFIPKKEEAPQATEE